MTGCGSDPSDSATPQLPPLDDRSRPGIGAVSPPGWTPPPETALGRARRLARFMPLIEAWSSPGPDRPALTMAERDLLTVVQLSVRRNTSLLIRLPGGLHRFPVLAAAMIAADSLDVPRPELARLSGDDPPPGPVALITARIIRRSELDRLDASSVPVAPALHPHRLRGDGLASPVRGGRPRLISGAARLLFVAPTTGFPPVLGVAPRVVVIDAAAEGECDWLPAARSWACAHGSVVITVADLHQEVELLRSGDGDGQKLTSRTAAAGFALPPTGADHENHWIHDWRWLHRTDTSLATQRPPSAEDSLHQEPFARGRAHLLTVEDPCFAQLAEVRQRLARLRDPRGGVAPWPVRQAARLTRLLTELPTRISDYDRVAPRHGGRTLRRLLDEVVDADAHRDFPASWRVRVAADWGAVRAGLSAVYEAMVAYNPVTSVVADLVEDAYRRGRQLDIVCGSRSARDALIGRLASSGTLRVEDSPLVTLRSIGTVEAAGSCQTTVLIGPPAARWQRRLTAADLGQLVVLGAPADFRRLYHALRSAYSTPCRETARDARCATLTALTGAPADEAELDGCELEVGVTTQPAEREPAARISLPDPQAWFTAALSEPPDDADLDLSDLEAEPDSTEEPAVPGATLHGRRVRAIPVVIRSTATEASSSPVVVLLAAAAKVQRLRDDEIRLLPVADLAAGMVVIGVSEPERRTLFDRIRPLLAEQRPQAAAMLLQLWRVALDDARAVTGSVADLTGHLGDLGADITPSAVGGWSSATRIGPQDAANVARIGRIAGSGIVVGEAARIAAVMRAARARHAQVGSALVKLAGWHASGDVAALDRAAETLGADITDLAADLTAWRVVAVGDLVVAPVSMLRRPMSMDDAARMTEPAPTAGTWPGLSQAAESVETGLPSSETLSGEDEA